MLLFTFFLLYLGNPFLAMWLFFFELSLKNVYEAGD